MNEEERRFMTIEEDIRELKVKVEKHSEEISELKQSDIRVEVYVKQIFERLDDLKAMFNTATQSNNNTWQKVVLELIKAIGIVASVVGAVKILG